MGFIIAIIVIICIVSFIYGTSNGIGFFSALGKILKGILKILLKIISFFFSEAVKDSERIRKDAEKKGYSFKDDKTEENFYNSQSTLSDLSSKAKEYSDKL